MGHKLFWPRWVVDIAKLPVISFGNLAAFVCSILYHVSVYVGGPKTWGGSLVPPVSCSGMFDHKTGFFLLTVREFNHSESNDMPLQKWEGGYP